MKKINSLMVVTLAVAVVTIAAIAQADPAPTSQLGLTMRDMAKQVMLITENSSDSTKNAASAALCDTLLSDIATARGLMPQKVQAMPGDQQLGQMAQYQQAIDQLSGVVSQLKTDFLGNNSSAVAQDLAQIQTIKSNGHQAFKGN